jgi:hypothetical protein
LKQPPGGKRRTGGGWADKGNERTGHERKKGRKKESDEEGKK